MQMNSLRTELNNLLRKIQTDRPPAVRRSRREEWLYTTDLPMLCNEDQLKMGISLLIKAGWETEPDDGWLHARKPADEPPEGWYSGRFGPEARCCLSLLDRHDRQDEGKKAVQTMLIKAGEEGDNAYEAACAFLHTLWAEKLRKQEKLPAVSRSYFGG